MITSATIDPPGTCQLHFFQNGYKVPSTGAQIKHQAARLCQTRDFTPEKPHAETMKVGSGDAFLIREFVGDQVIATSVLPLHIRLIYGSRNQFMHSLRNLPTSTSTDSLVLTESTTSMGCVCGPTFR